MPGNRRGRIDDRHPVAGDLVQQRADERVVGATQHERIDALGQHRPHHALQKRARLGRIQRPGLDQLHQPGASIFEDGDAAGKAGHQIGIAVAIERARRRQHPDFAAARGLRRRLDGRLHAHEGHVGEGLPQVVEGGGGGRVAGDDDEFCAAAQQEAGDGRRVGAHLGRRPWAIGDVGLVGEIDQVLARQQDAQMDEDGEATDAGIEDAHRAGGDRGDVRGNWLGRAIGAGGRLRRVQAASGKASPAAMMASSTGACVNSATAWRATRRACRRSRPRHRTSAPSKVRARINQRRS